MNIPLKMYAVEKLVSIHMEFFIMIGQRLLQDIFISRETRKYGYISFYEPIGLT